MWRSEVKVKCLPQSLFTLFVCLFFEIWSITKSVGDFYRFSISARSGILLSMPPQWCDYRSTLPCLAFLMGAGNMNSGPPVYTESTLSTEPSPTPSWILTL